MEQWTITVLNRKSGIMMEQKTFANSHLALAWAYSFDKRKCKIKVEEAQMQKVER